MSDIFLNNVDILISLGIIIFLMHLQYALYTEVSKIYKEMSTILDTIQKVIEGSNSNNEIIQEVQKETIKNLKNTTDCVKHQYDEILQIHKKLRSYRKELH